MRRSYSAAGTFSLSLSRLDIENPPGDIHRWWRTNLVVTGLWLLAFVQSPAKVDRLMELPAKVDRLQEEVRQITTDLAPIRGAHARDAAQRAVRRIARIVNCRLQEQLNDDDLHDFTANNDTTGITPEDLKSFENADIVLRANHRDTGEIHYIAVEASFTGGEDDTRRALRNARYLTRFTGQPAHAVVAAMRLTQEAEAAISQGNVTWYETERRHLESA